VSVNTDPIKLEENTKPLQRKKKNNKNNISSNESIIINKNVDEITNGKNHRATSSEASSMLSLKHPKTRFRVAVFAVIFMFRFPKYSKIFSKKEDNIFSMKSH